MLRWLSNASVRADRIHVTFGDTNMRLTETPDPPACGWWVRLQVEVAVKVSYAPDYVEKSLEQNIELQPL